MERSGCIIAGLALASLAFAAPVCAQDSGSMAVGNATVTVGGGTAILTLPDIEFTTVGDNTVAGISTFARNENQEIDGEIGWNINGSLEIPTNGWPGDIFAIKGFFPVSRGMIRCVVPAIWGSSAVL